MLLNLSDSQVSSLVSEDYRIYLIVCYSWIIPAQKDQFLIFSYFVNRSKLNTAIIKN